MASWIGTGGSNPGDVCTLGKVGIGTSGISQALHIYSTSAYPMAVIESTDGDGHGGDLYLKSNASSWEMYIEGEDLRFYSNEDKVTIKKSGNVGIGTTGPEAALDIQKAISATSGLAKGVNIEQTLTATADFDKLTAVRIKPTYNNGGVASCMTIQGLIVERGNVGIGVTEVSDYQLNVVAQDNSSITGAANPLGAICGSTDLSSTKAIYGHVGNVADSYAIYGFAANASSWAGYFYGGKGVEVSGNIKIGSSDYFYLGDANTDGSWRFHRSGNNLRFERRECGVWNDKGGFNA